MKSENFQDDRSPAILPFLALMFTNFYDRSYPVRAHMVGQTKTPDVSDS